MTAEELTDWIVNIGIDEFQTIDKQVQFKRKLETYHKTEVEGKIDKNIKDLRKNSAMEEHVKDERIAALCVIKERLLKQ